MDFGALAPVSPLNGQGKEIGDVDLKKRIFWIVVVVIVLAGIGLWAWMVPPIQADTTEVRNKVTNDAESFANLARQAGKEDVIKTAKHVEMANKYNQKLAEQLKELGDDLKGKKLELRFDSAPQQSGQFDIWLSELRQKITKQATDAGLQLPPDADRLMFRDPATDDNSQRVELRRGYRLRQMAIVEEVVDILSKKYGKQQVLKFEPDKDKTEQQEQADIGALALERVGITLPRSLGAAARAPEAHGADEKGTAATATATGGGATSEARARAVMEEALKRAGASGRTGPAGKAAATASSFVELPYSVTSLDIQFMAPLAAVPAIANALESSNRWCALVTRIEYERAVLPYPALTETKLAKAGPAPGLNTHYQEGPVRALVSLDLYEYDESKAKAAAAPPPPPKKAATKK